MQLQLEYKNPSELIPYANNARKHPQKQLQKLASSIGNFGFLVPIIVDERSGIIAGHARVEAAKILGLNKIPTILVDHLTEAQRRAFILADNRLNMHMDYLLQVE